MLGDREARTRLFLREWNVLDLAAAKYRDRGRQAVAENLALVVADDDERVRSGICKLAAQHIQRALASCVTLAPDLGQLSLAKPGARAQINVSKS